MLTHERCWAEPDSNANTHTPAVKETMENVDRMNKRELSS